MKKQVTMLTGLLLASSAMAQLQKGNGMLSGHVSVTYNRFEIPPNSNLSVANTVELTTNWNPAVTLTAGHFWTDNWLTGISLTGASAFNQQYPDSTLRFATLYATATPFVRRYWQLNSVYLFAGTGVTVGLNLTKRPFLNSAGQTIENGQQTTGFTVNPRLEAGINYFLTNRLGLQLLASANALPLTVTELSAGLVYWTGRDRRAVPQANQINAQTNAGHWLLEGSFSVASQQDKQIENLAGATNQTVRNTYSVNPSVGYFVGKNTIIGLSIPVTYSSTTTPTNSSSAIWSIGVSPYFQRYWSSTRLTPYTRLCAGYSKTSATSHATTSGVTREVYAATALTGGFSIGLAYMANRRFIIETSLLDISGAYTTYSNADSGIYNRVWTATGSAGPRGNFAVRYVL